LHSFVPNIKISNLNIYGLIGKSLTHSFSKKYFDEKFAAEYLLQHRFDLYELEHIENLKSVVTENTKGLAVTIPYKQQVIPFLHEIDEIAEIIHAVNCMKIVDGKLIGFNTDYLGFLKSIQPLLKPWHTHALVLGTGGASNAVQFTLQQLGIVYKTVSRNAQESFLTYGEIDKEILATYTIIINCTPLGTFPNVETFPELPYQYISNKHLLYDLVYNPEKTMFLKKGEEQGAALKNGYEMLVLQAEENWRIWNS
jgi:shikimate dehydrogenase